MSVSTESVDRRAAELTDAQQVRAWLHEVTPAERSRQINELSAGELTRFAALLGPSTGAEVIRSVEPDVAAELVRALDPRSAAHLVESLDFDDAAEVLRRLRGPDRDAVLTNVTPDVVGTIREMLQWPPESVAAHMVPEAFTVESELTAAEAEEAVRAQAPRVRGRAKVGAQIYVTDADRGLVGVVEFQDLVLAVPGQRVAELMDDDPVWVSPLVDAEDAALALVDNDLAALPIVDESRRLIGVLSAESAADILEDEATEDAERQGGSQPLDVPYLRASPLMLWRKRIVWLLVLFVAEAYTGTVLRAFEDELEAVVSLAFFIPLLIGTGGNTGTQITTTVVRALATKQVRFRDMPQILTKEVSTGLLIALSMAGVGLVRAWTLGVGPHVMLTVSLTLAAIVVWASIVASVLPLLLEKLRVDPALVSGPAIATIVDGTGLIIYFMIAHATLPQLAGL